MRRRFVAAAWIAGATIPLLLAVVFVMGCCVLPFHGIVHKLMPLCQMAAAVMSGNQDETPAPVPAKQEPVKRMKTTISPLFRLAATSEPRAMRMPAAAAAYRSFISLGAMRCDQDVGLHVLVDTFRI